MYFNHKKYFRASHPNKIERHVDLRCWMELGARVLGSIAQAIGRTSASERYLTASDYLRNPTLLADLHWSSYTDSFSDYGTELEQLYL